MATTLLIVKDLKVFGRSVIEGYLNGKTFEKISKENGVSKGTVFNIIKQWKDRVCVPDIDSLREFSVLVNKSGLTIEQCAQGFRFIKILSNFGITDELDIDYDPDPEDNSLVENSRLDTNAQIREEGNIGKKHANDTTTSRDSFHHFIARLYQDCKAHRIDSATMIRWIYDLLGFDFSDSKSVVNNPSVDDASNGYTPNLHKNVISKVTKDQIPFISKIDSYIEQKKIENQRLVDVRSLLYIDIERANEQKNTIDFNLKKAMEKEKTIINYYSWYKILKQQLQYNYGIALDEEFGSFVKAIDDFKNYNYDVLKLITDYKQVESLRKEKEKIQNIIDLNIPLRDSLLNQIGILEEILSYSKQTMNTYEELLKRGLGLKELKQLLNTLMEISLANKLPVLDTLPRFLKDIEIQYDNKLGFESTINNLKLEKEKLQAEVPEYKWYLQLQGVVGPIIIQLNNSGVTNEDIINLNNLVLPFKNSNFIDDLQVREDGNTMINNGTISNNEFWKRFIEKLKSLKNIYLGIDQSISISNQLKMQIERLNVQKQEVEKNYLKAVGNLNHVLTEASFSFHLTRHIQQEINKRLMSSARPNPIMFNLLIVGNKDEEKNKTENNDDK